MKRHSIGKALWIAFLLPLGVYTLGYAQEYSTQAEVNTESNSQIISETAQVDTLTQAYSDKWEGVPTGEETSVVERVLGSNNLIFVVLTVSLIIWFVLLAFLIRLDKKVTRIENSSKPHHS